MTVSAPNCLRTLRLKVKSEAYPWLNAVAIEVNAVWNFANATSYKAAQPFAGAPKWLSAFDLDKLTAGAGRFFEKIGSVNGNELPRAVAEPSQTYSRCEAGISELRLAA